MPSAHAPDSSSRSTRTSVARRVLLVLVFAIALAGTACGDGGDDDDSSDGGSSSGGNASTAETLEIFQASLDAIDPAAPDTVITIDAAAEEIDPDRNPVGALSSIGGTYSNGRLTSAQVEWVVYTRNDGTLQRVSTDPDGGLPTPIRVSSERAALPFCDALIAPDASDSTNARLAYGTDGATCSGDLAWRVVALSDDELTDPRDFPGQPLEALVDPATGAHLGWLALENGRLNRLAPDLSVETPRMLAGIQRGESLGATDDGTLFLEIDQALYAYDPQARRLKDLDFEFFEPCPCSAAFASDRDFGFLVDAGELHRADPARGRTDRVEAPDDALPSFRPHDFVTVGADRVAWSYTADGDRSALTQDDQETVVRSVERNGSRGLELDRYERSATALPAFSGFVAASSDAWLFYNRLTSRSTGPVAMTLHLEGGKARLSLGVLWVGSSRAPVVGPARLGPVTRMLQLGGISDLTNLANNRSLDLESIDPDDPRGTDLELGDLPSDAQFAYALPGFGPNRVGVLLAPDGFGDLRSDLIFWHDETPSSLRRVTETVGRDEYPAPQF